MNRILKHPASWIGALIGLNLLYNGYLQFRNAEALAAIQDKSVTIDGMVMTRVRSWPKGDETLVYDFGNETFTWEYKDQKMNGSFASAVASATGNTSEIIKLACNHSDPRKDQALRRKLRC